MSNKIIIAATIAGILALGGTSFAVGRLASNQAVADEGISKDSNLLTDLKIGKYYGLAELKMNTLKYTMTELYRYSASITLNL